jgi:hypothetical protein
MSADVKSYRLAGTNDPWQLEVVEHSHQSQITRLAYRQIGIQIAIAVATDATISGSDGLAVDRFFIRSETIVLITVKHSVRTA